MIEWLLAAEIVGFVEAPPKGGEILRSCVVEKVHDGDTITAFCPHEGKVKVRFYCIDAPELAQKPWGRQARDHLKELVGKHVSIRPIVQDRYGRTVAVVSNRRYPNINLKMVEDGWAAVYPRYCKEKRYYGVQEESRRFRRGIWKVAGLHQRPWEYRRRRRTEQREEGGEQNLWKRLLEWLERRFR